MEEIAEDIEESEESLEWVGQSCDVVEYYNWAENMEFLENVEWASEIRGEKLYNDITEDNDYIDFEE